MSENTYRCPACRASFTTRGALPAGKTIRCGKCQAVINLQPDRSAGLRPPALPVEAAVKAKRPPADEEDDTPRTKRQEPSRGGVNVVLILVGVGLAAVLLCVAPLSLVAVLWFGMSRPPTMGAVSRPKQQQQQTDLLKEILGRWLSGPDRVTHEFLPDGLYVRRTGDVPAGGSYTLINDNEIELVTRPRPDQPRTERFRVELKNGELTLASAGGGKKEVCRRAPDPAAAATDAQLTGAWVGDAQDGKGTELEFTAGKEFHQTSAGDRTSGSWRLAGVNLLERKYPAGLPTDYATVCLGPDTLELITQSRALRFKRRASAPTTSGPRVELKKRKTLAKQDQVFDGVTVSPGGELLAVRTAFEGPVRLIPVLGRGEPREVAMKDPVDRLVFSPDGKTLALGHTFSGKIRLCDVQKGAVTGEVSHPDKRFVEIAYLPEGTLLAIGPDRTIIWDTKKEKTTSSVATPKVRGLPLYRVAPAGEFVACPGEKPGEVITWDPQTGKGEVLVPAPGAPFARVERIAISPDATKVAIEGPDQGVELWDARARKRAGTIKAGAVHGMTFSPDGRFLVCSDRGGGITYWDVGTLKAVGKMDAGPTPATKWFFTAGGRGLIPCDDNAKEITLWDVAEAK